MATLTLEDRVTAVEAELAQLKRQMQTNSPPCETTWWEQFIGSRADSPVYDEIVRLGREYRESQREDYDTDEETS